MIGDCLDLSNDPERADDRHARPNAIIRSAIDGQVVCHPVNGVVHDLRADEIVLLDHCGVSDQPGVQHVLCLIILFKLAFQVSILFGQRGVNVFQQEIFTNILRDAVQAGDERIGGIKKARTLVLIVLNNQPGADYFEN